MVPKKIKWSEIQHHWEIYLFILPTLFLIGLFQYYPAASGVIHSFFRWNGADISEWVGWNNYADLIDSDAFWDSFSVAFILGAWNIMKMVPPLIVAVCIHRCKSDRVQFLYRCMFVIPMVMPGFIVALLWRSFFFDASAGYLNQLLHASGLFDLLTRLDGIFHLGSMDNGVYHPLFTNGVPPNWLGDPKLIVVACVFWGFPWVGSFAVLTHLAKLQNISKDVYEAGDIDGVSWWTKFTRIELPLLMSSIYLLLVLTVIETIKDAATILAIADMDGGPGGAVNVPALFMLRKAMKDNQMGYACTIGIILTLIVLILQKLSTILLNWNDLTKRQKLQLRIGCGIAGAALVLSGHWVWLGALMAILSLPTLTVIGILWRALKAFFDRAPEIDWETRLKRESELRASPAHRQWNEAKGFFLRFAKHFAIWMVLASALLPVYLMLVVSLKNNNQFAHHPAAITTPYHLENWTLAWNTLEPALANSIFISISTTLATLVFALGGSYFFARLRMPFSGFLWNAVLVLMMMPSIANLIPLFGLLRDIHLLNSLSALILVGTATGQVFSIFVLRNFIADLPQDLFEAAEIDGASHFQQLKTIVVPLSGTIVGTVGVMLFIQQWNDFVLPLIVMRDQTRLPIMVAMQHLSSETVPQFGPLMAGYALASIPIIVLFILSMKLFIKGMTEGAVKG